MTLNSEIMKPKLGFSIESLVGSQQSPTRTDRGTDVDRTESPRARSPASTSTQLSLGSLFPKSLLSLQERIPTIQRPQPINGVPNRQSPLGADNLGGGFPFQSLQPPKTLPLLPNPLVSQHLGFPLNQIPGLPFSGHLNPLMMGGSLTGLGSAIPREYPLYPWLLSRHSRVFPGGLPGPEQLAYLLQPFRKPKRIRTAFSPTQLLKLEQAFERNQYVVGAERKQLAISLHLSETQVKVWFQNRRTKEKRSGPEEEASTNGKPHEDEEIDNEDIEEDNYNEVDSNTKEDFGPKIDEFNHLKDIGAKIDDFNILKRSEINQNDINFNDSKRKRFSSDIEYSSTHSTLSSYVSSSTNYVSSSTLSPVISNTSLPSSLAPLSSPLTSSHLSPSPPLNSPLSKASTPNSTLSFPIPSIHSAIPPTLAPLLSSVFPIPLSMPNTSSTHIPRFPPITFSPSSFPRSQAEVSSLPLRVKLENKFSPHDTKISQPLSSNRE